MYTSFGPIDSIALLFWTAVFACLAALVADPFYYQVIKRDRRIVFIALLAVVIWRLPLHGVFFQGLDVDQDSYVGYPVSGAS